MAIDIVTFGCRLNTYKSEVMRREAEAAGLGSLDNGAVIFNTCAVTAEAVRQAKQSIRKARREKPKARIIVTGCAAQTDPQGFAAMGEVDLVLGNEEKLDRQNYRALPDFGVNDTEKARVNDIMSVRETAAHMVDAIEGRARAFVQVQNGCDHRCTFCIIPYGRGNSRSVPMGAVVEQVKRLAGNGYAEIVLTGVDMTSYGADLPGSSEAWPAGEDHPAAGSGCATPAGCRRSIRSRRTAICWRRSPPSQRLMPHLHLSLQAGDDMILKRMKRRHLRDDSIRFCEDVRTTRPGIVFGADIIAGFPTETEEMFVNSLKHRRGVRADASACVPVQPARGNTGSEDAAGQTRDRQGARGAAARGGRSGLSPPSRRACWNRSVDIGRAQRRRPHRRFRAGRDRCRPTGRDRCGDGVGARRRKADRLTDRRARGLGDCPGWRSVSSRRCFPLATRRVRRRLRRSAPLRGGPIGEADRAVVEESSVSAPTSSPAGHLPIEEGEARRLPPRSPSPKASPRKPRPKRRPSRRRG